MAHSELHLPWVSSLGKAFSVLELLFMSHHIPVISLVSKREAQTDPAAVQQSNILTLLCLGHKTSFNAVWDGLFYLMSNTLLTSNKWKLHHAIHSLLSFPPSDIQKPEKTSEKIRTLFWGVFWRALWQRRCTGSYSILDTHFWEKRSNCLLRKVVLSTPWFSCEPKDVKGMNKNRISIFNICLFL